MSLSTESFQEPHALAILNIFRTLLCYVRVVNLHAIPVLTRMPAYRASPQERLLSTLQGSVPAFLDSTTLAQPVRPAAISASPA